MSTAYHLDVGDAINYCDTVSIELLSSRQPLQKVCVLAAC